MAVLSPPSSQSSGVDSQATTQPTEFIDEISLLTAADERRARLLAPWRGRYPGALLPVDVLGDTWCQRDPLAASGCSALGYPSVSTFDDGETLLTRWPRLPAHGVGRVGPAGGRAPLALLLNIILEGAIRAGTGHVCFGDLASGSGAYADPTLFSGKHGPYFVVIERAAVTTAMMVDGVISAAAHLAYIVPTSLERDLLTRGFGTCVLLGLCDREFASEALLRVVTHADMLASGDHPTVRRLHAYYASLLS